MGREMKIICILVCIWTLLLLSMSSPTCANPYTRSFLTDDAEGTPDAPTPSPGPVPSSGIIDLVANCGAKENEDITEQVFKAWTDACASPTSATVLIPAGVFNLGEIVLSGPCNAPITFQLDGTVKAPSDPKAFKDPQWVAFVDVHFLTITGSGIFDGQGPQAWAASGCHNNAYCPLLPINIRLDKVKDAYITGITSQDSKNFNVNLCDAENVTFEKFNVVTSPGSMNTDGIHVGRSNHVKIIESNFVCGDDCISVGDGTMNMEVRKVICGPGHGISIGSLGKFENEKPVMGIHVKDCSISNADNGARLKAWAGRFPCSVDDVLFEGITMDNVTNPVILDMCYCPHQDCNPTEPSLVKMSNIVFRNIKGTCACPEAVQIMCSPNMCESIELCDIDIAYEGPPDMKQNFTTWCSNVKPKITPPLNPPGPTCC